MRLLEINGAKIDIDEQTAIGVTFQSYDIKDIGARKVNISNSFSVPLTSSNLEILGNAGNSQTISKKVYELSSCNYYVDNQQLIQDSRVRVDFISDRINLFLYQKESFWDSIKLLKWNNFVKEYITYLHEVHNLPSRDNPFIGTFADFVDTYVDNYDTICLRMYLSNLYNYDPLGGENYIETPRQIYLKYATADGTQADGGHFLVFIKSIFKWIEYKYNVNFLSDGGQLDGNLFDDNYFNYLVTPIRNLSPRFYYEAWGELTGFYFEYNETPNFAPLDGQKDKEDKTLHDLVSSVFKMFNVVKDELEIEGSPVIRLARFDDIENIAEVVDFSGRLSGTPVFKPYIPNFFQENLIKFSKTYDNGSSLNNSKTLTCQNKNIDAYTDLFQIDGYVNKFLAYGATKNFQGDIIADLSESSAFETFSFFVLGAFPVDNLVVKMSDGGADELETTISLDNVLLYSLSSEYNFFNKILQYPVYYEIEKWLTFNEVKNLQYFKQYWIRELNGSFFINKITGYNPEKSNQPTKIELFKLSDKTPIAYPFNKYWSYGADLPWTDGLGNYWTYGL